MDVVVERGLAWVGSSGGAERPWGAFWSGEVEKGGWESLEGARGSSAVLCRPAFAVLPARGLRDNLTRSAQGCPRSCREEEAVRAGLWGPAPEPTATH